MKEIPSPSYDETIAGRGLRMTEQRRAVYESLMARKDSKFANSFWVGYSDLMTSLFFVFLVIATTLALAFRAQAEEGEAAKKELERIRAIADVSR